MKLLYLMLVVFIIGGTFVSADLNCSILPTDIEIQMDTEPYLSSTMSFLAVLPQAYKTHSVKCWSYVKALNGQYQQTNPQKQDYSKTFFSTAKKTESREYFTAQNGVVNAYFTDKNLVSYNQFILGIRCVSENTGDTIEGETCFTPSYDDLRRVTARSVWAVKNMEMLWVVGFGTLLAIFLMLWVLKNTKRSLW